jgi:S-adenosylmethionine:tRNA ribosyltransferase-isomerase
MNNPKEIAIADYTYSLPEERIAKYPLAKDMLSNYLYLKKRK